MPEENKIAKTKNDLKHVGKRIYILSVGINHYKNPRIRDLNGCVNDTYRLKELLQSMILIPEAQYKIITDEQATRNGMITAFREHFAKLQDGDIALFHYSGHGSWEKTSSAFVDAGLEPPGGRNEVLVCHDSGEPGIFKIADKELRWLISEIQFPKNKKNRDIHFLCLFDCCHAGSMLRNEHENIKVRMHAGVTSARPIEAYLEGQYAQMPKLVLPPANYISLTACSPRESAVENETGGVFTNAIIQTLATTAKPDGFPSYSSLFSIIREITKRRASNLQTPYFEYSGTVNPYDAFLLQGRPGEQHFPQMVKKDEAWRATIGAIHGLDSDSLREMKIPVFDPSLSEKDSPVAYAYVDQVELEYTRLRDISWIAEKDQSIQDKDQNLKTFQIGLAGYQLPLILSGTEEAATIKNSLLAKMQQMRNQRRFQIAPEADYELNIDNNRLSLYQHNSESKNLIYGINQTNDLALQHIIDQLSKISRWEQVNAIYTSKQAGLDPDLLDFSFCYENYEGQMETFILGSPEGRSFEKFQLTIPFDASRGAIPYNLKVKNNTQDALYFYLIHLDRRYGIYQKHEAYLKNVYYGETITLYDSYSKGVGLGIPDKSIDEIQDTFLLIASQEMLSIPHTFEQAGFGPCFGRIAPSLKAWRNDCEQQKREDLSFDTSKKVSWAVKRLEVKIRRKG